VLLLVIAITRMSYDPNRLCTHPAVQCDYIHNTLCVDSWAIRCHKLFLLLLKA
jgi:hypothetical protein